MVSTATADLPAEVIELLKDRSALKVLATVDEQGNPHAVFKGSLTLGDEGFLVYRETLESSRTNANVLRSLWFDRKVAVLIVGKNGHAYQIKGKPYRYVINGPLFKQHYMEERERQGPDSDVAGVWLIAPEEVRTQTFEVRKQEEDRKHPYLRHLDRSTYLQGGDNHG